MLFCFFALIIGCEDAPKTSIPEPADQGSPVGTDDTADTGDTDEVIDPIEANRKHPTTTCSGGGGVRTSSGIRGSFCFAPIALGSQFQTSSSSYTLQVGSILIVSP